MGLEDTMQKKALLFDEAEEIDPRLVGLIEQALLFGKVEELDALLGWVADEDTFPEDFRRDIEVLRHFRAYYGRKGLRLSEKDQALVVRWDADWTMHLIKRLHQKFLGDALSDFMSSANSIA